MGTVDLEVWIAAIAIHLCVWLLFSLQLVSLERTSVKETLSPLPLAVRFLKHHNTNNENFPRNPRLRGERAEGWCQPKKKPASPGEISHSPDNLSVHLARQNRAQTTVGQ